MKRLVFALLVLAALGACKKKKEVIEQPVTEQVRIKSILDGTTGQGENFIYDNKGRLIKRTRTDNQRRDEYSYSGNMVTHNLYNTAGVLEEIFVYELNDQGLVVKRTRTINPSSNIETYIYNSNKQLLTNTSQTTAGIYKADYYYTGSVRDSTVNTQADGSFSVNTYVYDVNIRNTITAEYSGESIWGNNSPYAITKRTFKSYSPSRILLSTTVNTHTYETDAAGRITSVTTSNSAGERTLLYQYY